MLTAAARLARLLTTPSDRDYLERRARASVVTSAAWLVAGVMALLAVIFVQVAIFAALLQVMPAWGAALVVAAVAVVLAGIAVLVAHRPSRHESLPDDGLLQALANDPGAAATEALAPLVDEALRATRERPSETMLLALAAGVLAGRLLRPPKR